MKKKLSTLGDFGLMSTPAAVVLLATAVFAASVILAVMMVMVVTFGIGIISKVPCNKALYLRLYFLMLRGKYNHKGQTQELMQ